MPRYINDDAPVTPGIRQAARITADDLKQIMIRQYNASVSVKQCNAVFDENNYSDHNQAVTDLMAVLTCDEQKVSVDRSNIDFENDILQLHDRMVPLQSSHTSSGKGKGEGGEVGRPAKENDEVADKTLQNRASMG